MTFLVIFVVLIVSAGMAFFFRHQNQLKLRARLMHEAVRNHDFTFRLPVKGLFYGERALQEALNDLGQVAGRLVAQQEVESWQKLIRVLTHEIMNVSTPIRSISQAYLEHPKVVGTSLERGIRAINEASQSLVTLVDSYRKLTQLQDPVVSDLPLRDFVAGIKALYPEVEWRTDVSDGVTVRTDGTLLRQVVVNIVKNAVEAGAKRIAMEWEVAALAISNDGAPIAAEVRKDLFVPFFTTKQAGLGVGLALSRQIMAVLGGSLVLADKAHGGYHTTFVLDFEPDAPC
ncbi:MAG: sensor histidine kinase [Alloprevotella sp.]